MFPLMLHPGVDMKTILHVLLLSMLIGLSTMLALSVLLHVGQTLAGAVVVGVYATFMVCMFARISKVVNGAVVPVRIR